MKLHKPPTILIKLENANPVTGIGYIYLKVLVPGSKKYIARALSLKAHKDFWDKENEMVLKNGKDAARINDIIFFLFSHNWGLIFTKYRSFFEIFPIFGEIILKLVVCISNARCYCSEQG